MNSDIGQPWMWGAFIVYVIGCVPGTGILAVPFSP